MEMAARKQLATAEELSRSGTLLPAVRAAAEESIRRKWKALGDAERQVYIEMYKVRHAERKRAASSGADAASAADIAARDSRSHWAAGTRGYSVDPSLVQAFFESGGKMPAKHEIYDESEFVVADAPPGPVLEPQGRLFACGQKGRNLCHDDADAVAIDKVVLGFNRLVRAIGGKTCKIGNVLMLCVGERPYTAAPGPRPRVFAFMSGVSLQPMHQDFTLCEPASGHDIHQEGLAFPLDLRIAESVVRLPIDGIPPQVCIRHSTSDELAKHLVRIAEFWTVQEVVYTDLSPMLVRVTGCKGDNVIECRRTEKVSAPRLPADVSQALGALMTMQHLGSRGKEKKKKRVEPSSSSRPSSVGGAVVAAIVDAPEPQHPKEDHPDLFEWYAEDEDAGAPDDVGLGTLPADLLRFGLEEAPEGAEMHRDIGVDDAALVAAGSADTEPTLSIEEDAVAATQEIAETVLVGSGVAPDELPDEPDDAPPRQDEETAPPPVPASEALAALGAELVEGAPIGWAKLRGGYIINQDQRRIGRITQWGDNLACKCYLHGGKCSLAKKKKVATDAMAMRWLEMGQGLEPTSSSSDAAPSAKDLARQHINLWAQVK